MGVDGDKSPALPLNLRLLNKIRAGVAAAVAVLAFGCGSDAIPVPTPVTQPTPPPRPMAVIISVDGLRPDSLSVVRTPNILDMAGRGTACWQAQTTFPPITLPSHASMLTGYPPSIHGLTWGDYQPARGNSKVPTIFSYARAAGMRTVMVVGKDKLNHLRLDGSLDAYDLVGGDDEAKVNHAIVQIQAGADLLLVHLPDVDISGHNSGWMSDRYLQQVAEADRAIGRLLSALPRHATVLLTADHGGTGPTHGVDRVQDMTIPWIVMGPDIEVNHVVGRRISTMDTAATVMDLLGLSLASNAVGRPVTEAYKPESSAARRHLALR